LCLLSLGYGESARLVAMVFGTTGIVLIHVARALTQAPSARAEIVRLAGLRGFDAVRCLHAYEMLPALFTGTRLALTGALIISVVTEMLVGARYGLGCRAQTALLEYRADMLWLVILLAGVASVAMSALLLGIERRLVDWREA
jgi:ABC-type nitrate/sulfonate/bicarbonate transport system permease component